MMMAVSEGATAGVSGVFWSEESYDGNRREGHILVIFLRREENYDRNRRGDTFSLLFFQVFIYFIIAEYLATHYNW